MRPVSLALAKKFLKNLRMWLDYSKGHSKFCIDAGAGKYEVFKDPFSTKTVWVLNYSAIKTFFCSTQQINHRAGFDVRYPLLFTPGPSSPPLLGPRASGTLTRNKSSLLVSSSIILGGTFQQWTPIQRHRAKSRSNRAHSLEEGKTYPSFVSRSRHRPGGNGERSLSNWSTRETRVPDILVAAYG